MASGTTTHDIDFDDNNEDDVLYNKKRRRRNPELSRYLECVTPAKDFRTYALYEDDLGRLYTARVTLTEDANRAPTKLDTPERYIYFDVYLIPMPRNREIVSTTQLSVSNVISASTTRKKREKPKRQEKASVPEEGEKIVLHLRKARASDKVSVKAFVATVEEVYWGSLVTEKKDTGNLRTTREENLGTIKVSVTPYEDIALTRSLIVLPAYDLEAGARELPL